MNYANPRSLPVSAPWERRVARWVQFSGLVAGETERFKQFLRLVHKLLRHQGADPDHLVAVVGVGDDVGILPEGVEDGEAIRGEAPDTARGLFGEQVALAFEASVAVGERRGPHPGEVFSDHEVGALWSVGVDGDLAGGLIDDIGCGPALYPVEVEVGFVIDPPELVGDEFAVFVVEWGVGVYVDHRRHLAFVIRKEARLDPQHTLLQRPVRPHLTIGIQLAIRTLDGDPLGQVEHVPEVPDPRADRHEELLAADHASIRLDGVYTTVFHAKSGNPDPGVDLHALGLGFGGEGPYGGPVVRVPSAVLVQDARDVLGLPIVEDVLHVGAALLFPLDERRRVADRLLFFVDLHHVAMHHLG